MEAAERMVTVKWDRQSFQVNVAQDAADVVDDLIEEIWLVVPDGPYEWVAELADKLALRALAKDPGVA